MENENLWEVFWEGASWKMFLGAALLSPIIIFGMGLMFCVLG